MSRLSAVLDLIDGTAQSKRPRENEKGGPPKKLPRLNEGSKPSASAKPSKPSKPLPAASTVLDEGRAMKVISIELDLLMGRRTAPIPLTLLRSEWRQLPKGDLSERSLLTLDDAPQGLVTSPSLCASIASLFRVCPFIAVDCEWSGSNLSTVQIASPAGHVFVFDVLGDSGKGLFDAGLRELLEDEAVIKVLHDCRQDALFLARAAKVNLKPVFDTQIAFAFVTRLRTSRTPLPCALNTVLRVFAHGSENLYKERARALMEADPQIWAKRPLDDVLLAYAMDDVRALPRAYLNASAALGEANLPLVREYSAAYAAQLRSLTTEELYAREERLKTDNGGARPLPKYNIARWDDEAASTLRGQPQKPLV